MPFFKKGGFKFKRSKKAIFNKYQKKAYKRRKKAYRNRQQKLSIKTVKQIAKDVSKKVPEVKFYENNAYINQKAIIQSPADAHNNYISQVLIGPNLIPKGTGQSQRVADDIRVKGIHFRIRLHNPVKQSLLATANTFKCGQYNQVHIKLVKLRNSGDVKYPPAAPQLIQDDLWTYQGALNKSTNDYSLITQTLYHKVVHIRSRLQPSDGTTVTTGTVVHNASPPPDEVTASTGVQINNGYNVPKTILIDKYVKIDKPLRFLGTQQEDVKYQYFLWIYGYALNQDPLTGTTWGNNPDYAVRCDYNWCVYYTDA